MLSFLFQRPIAVLTTFAVVLVFSAIAFFKLPISLLPDIDVPQIVIKVNYPNGAPAEIEQNILRLVREALLTVSHLKDIESRAHSENGQVDLFFEYGSNMELAYIEVNEKIDQLTSRLPRDLARPQVIRINTSDVPVARLQVVSREAGKMIALSELAEKVLKKRLEALEGVSLVDMNGLQRRSILVEPDEARMQALGITEQQLVQVIQQSNEELNTISVKDGQYRYFMKLTAQLRSSEDVANISFPAGKGTLVSLGQLAQVRDTMSRLQGLHLFKRQEGIVITIHKQSQAQMPLLMEQLEEAVAYFKTDYPEADFVLTQNQSELLDAAIGNLQSDLLFGGVFAFLMLFVFIGNYRIPFLIGIILPSSLLMSFLIFYVFGISINIISLSGLALGLGMTIDNAIIIFDNIVKKRQQGIALLESCVEGTAEMIPPLVSSSLTTQAVFIPLVFLNDLSGALSYDQAVAVGAILFTSLLVSFFLLPLLYLLLFRNSKHIPQEDNRLYKVVLKGYKRLYYWIYARRKVFFPVLMLLGLAGLSLALLLPVEGLPAIERRDLAIRIQWNEAIDLSESRKRIENLLAQYEDKYLLSESDLGIQQFLLQKESSLLQEAQLYMLFESSQQQRRMSQRLKKQLRMQYPNASIEVGDAPNTFDLVFRQSKPYFEARWKPLNAQQAVEPEQLLPFLTTLEQDWKGIPWKRGIGTQQETQVRIALLQEKLQAYQIPYTVLMQRLKNALGELPLTRIRNFGEELPIQLYEGTQSFQQKMNNSFIRLDSTRIYPLSQLVRYDFYTYYRTITADKTGIYHGIDTEKLPSSIGKLTQDLSSRALAHQMKVDFSGQYYDNQENLRQLMLILVISILLLYFILTVEFESFRQPLIVVFTLPLGFTGSFLLLWLAGASLNIMSAIGLVVMLGIIDNESILKIDTMNRLRKHLPLDEAIAKAGEVCFKPVLMTSLTNILALLPFLFDSGIGADLQRPFVLAIIGGLSIGTFTALFFVPLMYRALMPADEKIKEEA